MQRFMLSAMLVVTASTVHAGPDATASFLMNDAVSSMDFGIYKLEQRVIQWTTGGSTIVIAEYSWDDNKIMVSVIDTNSQNYKTREAAVSGCKGFITTVRSALGIDLSTGAPYGKNLGASQFFGHEGFTRKSAPKTINNDIDGMVRIKGTVYFASSPKPASVNCEAPLLGKDVLVAQ